MSNFWVQFKNEVFCVWRFFIQKAKEYPRHHTLTIGKQVKIAVD